MRKRRGSYILLGLLTAITLCIRSQAVTTTVRVGVSADLPPFQFLDQDGSLSGMHIDLLEAIAQQCGLILQYEPMVSQEACLAALDAGRVDMVMGVETGALSAYDGQYTEPISTANLCLLASNATAAALRGGASMHDYRAVYEYGTVRPYMMPSLGVQYYLAEGDAVQLLSMERQGKADLVLGIKESLLYQLYADGAEDDYTILNDYITAVSYSILLPKDNFRLRELLNSAIPDLRISGAYRDIYARWMVDENENALQRVLKKVWSLTALALVCVGAYVAVTTRVRLLLQRKVEERTRTIQLVNRQLEQKIEQIRNEAKLRSDIIETSSGGIILFDSARRVALANRGACALAGCPSIPPGADLLALPVFGDILRSQEAAEPAQTVRRTDYFIPEEAGERRCYRYTLHPATVEGSPGGGLLTVEDVTLEERKKQEISEADKNKSLNRIIAGIAHEIRNPLMSIRTFASLMKTHQNDPRVQESFAKYVPGEVDQINRLVESLIHYAKPDTAQKTAVGVNDLVEECAFLAGTLSKGKAISVETVLPEEEPQIWVSRGRIKQVVVNLVMNSIDALSEKLERRGAASGEPLRLVLSAQAEGAFVFISIYDEGTGMSEEVQNSCTAPFFTTKVHGTGLGLALAQQFVQENEGTFTLESQPDSYTCATLKFRRYPVCSQRS